MDDTPAPSQQTVEQQLLIDDHQRVLLKVMKELNDIKMSIAVLRTESKEDKSFAAFTISIVLVLIMAGILSMSLIAIFSGTHNPW